MAVDSTGFNPYAMQYGLTAQNTYGQDFMSDATGITNPYVCQPDATRVAKQPAFTGNLSGQPATDCYQGSSALTDGLKLAAAGGAGVGLGMYYFGGDKVSPLVNGKFDDQFLKTFEGDHVEKINAILKNNKNIALEKILKANGISKAQYDALKNIVETGEVGSGYRGSFKKVPTVEDAQATLNKINSALSSTFDEEKELAKITKDYMRNNSLSGSTEYLRQLRVRESLIDGMKDTDSLEKLIKDNAKAFGIEATEETKIAEEAKKLASEYKNNKAEALKHLREHVIKPQENLITTLRNSLESKAKSYWDEAGKCIREGAPESAQKAFKNFKFTKAGKAGLIAAGVGLVLGWMFGGKS